MNAESSPAAPAITGARRRVHKGEDTLVNLGTSRASATGARIHGCVAARRRVLQGSWLTGAVLLLAGCTRGAGVGPAAIAGQRPDATVEMSMAQAAYIGSAGGGRGVLRFGGRSYPFRVGGAGIGGIGASTIEARGEVYNLRNVAEFGGTYAQARYGIAVGRASSGELWLQNEAGVIMRLAARRTGLMLSMGGDAVVISLDSVGSDRSRELPVLIARSD